jgi:hypothetical protein
MIVSFHVCFEVVVSWKNSSVSLTRRHVMKVFAATAACLDFTALSSAAAWRHQRCQRTRWKWQSCATAAVGAGGAGAGAAGAGAGRAGAGGGAGAGAAEAGAAGAFQLQHANGTTRESTSLQCFLRGTRVLTSDGEIRVEEIGVGDLIVTERGESVPVKRVRRRRFKRATSSNRQRGIIPVRIMRFALDERIPHRDLYVSPAHALFIDGVLIPAIHLANGSSIVQAMPEGVEEIEYFHIELETHEVMFAEGAAVETLLEMNDHAVLCEADTRSGMTPYAPVVCYNGGLSELKALLRRAAFPLVDIRDPIQMAYDRIAARAANSNSCPRVRQDAANA